MVFTSNRQLEAGNWVQGAVAQLGERLVCNQEATGSIPVSSTTIVVSHRSAVVGPMKQADDRRLTTDDKPNVGRQGNNRFRIRLEKSCLAPNIGLEDSCELLAPGC